MLAAAIYLGGDAFLKFRVQASERGLKLSHFSLLADLIKDLAYVRGSSKERSRRRWRRWISLSRPWRWIREGGSLRDK